MNFQNVSNRAKSAWSTLYPPLPHIFWTAWTWGFTRRHLKYTIPIQKKWVNRDWVTRFFWQFLVISELGSQIYMVISAILVCWAFILILFHGITLSVIDINSIGCLEPFLPLVVYRFFAQKLGYHIILSSAHLSNCDLALLKFANISWGKKFDIS